MSSESPASVLYSSDGYELAVVPGSADSANPRALLINGNVSTAAPSYLDGTVNDLSIDILGNLRVLSKQGAPNTVANSWPTLVTDGTNTAAVTPANTSPLASSPALVVAISPNSEPFTVTVVNGADGYTNAAPPAQATYMGGDVTTNAPTYTNGTINALSLDTMGNLRTLANQGTPASLANAWPVKLTDGYGNLFGESNNPLYVTISGGSGSFNNQAIGGTASATPSFAELMGGAVTTAAPTYVSGQMDPLSLDTSGNLRTLSQQGAPNTLANAWPVELTDGTNVLGTGAHPVTVSVSGTVATVADKSSTGTLTQVSAAQTSTTILASNANRIGASFYNASSNMLYLALNATASTSAFTIRIMPNSYYDLPVDYTGTISGIWNGSNGNVQVTELT
jgi:hypothetical protein